MESIAPSRLLTPRSLFAVIASAALAGCVAASSAAPDRVALQNGRLTIAAPNGYCLDRASLRDGPNGAFALFGDCAVISGDASAPRPAYRAMLSATVGPPAAGEVASAFAGFRRFFQSASGRAALARSGLARDVDILKIEQRPGMMLVKTLDRSHRGATGAGLVYWRAVTGLNGRIVALAVTPLAGGAIPDAAQIGLLEAFSQAILAAQPTRA